MSVHNSTNPTGVRTHEHYYSERRHADLLQGLGNGPASVFPSRLPALSAGDRDAQMMFFLGHGYRVIAHDRRGHGRSTQTVSGNDIDTYATDVAELVKALDLKNAVHIGHSTGGIRYVARHAE